MAGDIWHEANWPAPDWLHAGTTLRSYAGTSLAPYQQFNLATHVGDEAGSVKHNRQLLCSTLNLPTSPLWLDQIHSAVTLNADGNPTSFQADAAYTYKKGMVVAVLTADCLPLLICDKKRRQIAAIHVGWRGFCQGILTNAMQHFAEDGKDCMAWIGPCISGPKYEVDKPVHEACLQLGEHLSQAFSPNRPNHWQLDLKQLVTLELQQRGLNEVYVSSSCTFSEEQNWFSYRRDGETGRMATLIWMD